MYVDGSSLGQREEKKGKRRRGYVEGKRLKRSYGYGGENKGGEEYVCMRRE